MSYPAPSWDEGRYIACFSDLHFFARDQNRDRLKDDLNEADRLGADIYIIGDIFDAILWNDPRFAPGVDELDETTAFDRVVEMVADYLEPYADRIRMIGVGNHESTHRKYHHVDPIWRLIGALESRRKSKGSPIFHGGYRGFLRMQFTRDTKSRKRMPLAADEWFYDHGKGGSAPKTRGLLDIDRIMRTWIADVYWMGHKHTSPSDEPRRVLLDRNGNEVVQNVTAFFTAGYKSKVEAIDYNKTRGYNHVDWESEKFYDIASEGSAIVRYYGKHVGGYYQLHRQLIKGGQTTTRASSRG